MNFGPTAARYGWHLVVCGVAALLLLGCSTPAINWDERVGVYTWDDAITELGEPTRVTDEEGGVKTAEWVTQRTSPSPTSGPDPVPYFRGETTDPEQSPGRSAPPLVLRLSFSPDGKLFSWERNYY